MNAMSLQVKRLEEQSRKLAVENESTGHETEKLHFR